MKTLKEIFDDFCHDKVAIHLAFHSDDYSDERLRAFCGGITKAQENLTQLALAFYGSKDENKTSEQE